MFASKFYLSLVFGCSFVLTTALGNLAAAQGQSQGITGDSNGAASAFRPPALQSLNTPGRAEILEMIQNSHGSQVETDAIVERVKKLRQGMPGGPKAPAYPLTLGDWIRIAKKNDRSLEILRRMVEVHVEKPLTLFDVLSAVDLGVYERRGMREFVFPIWEAMKASEKDQWVYLMVYLGADSFDVQKYLETVGSGLGESRRKNWTAQIKEGLEMGGIELCDDSSWTEVAWKLEPKGDCQEQEAGVVETQAKFEAYDLLLQDGEPSPGDVLRKKLIEDFKGYKGQKPELRGLLAELEDARTNWKELSFFETDPPFSSEEWRLLLQANPKISDALDEALKNGEIDWDNYASLSMINPRPKEKNSKIAALIWKKWSALDQIHQAMSIPVVAVFLYKDGLLKAKMGKVYGAWDHNAMVQAYFLIVQCFKMAKIDPCADSTWAKLLSQSGGC